MKLRARLPLAFILISSLLFSACAEGTATVSVTNTAQSTVSNLPTTAAPTTVAPTTVAATTAAPTTVAPTTVAPTTAAPTTVAPTTAAATTVAPTTSAATIANPTVGAGITNTTSVPTTVAATSAVTTGTVANATAGLAATIVVATPAVTTPPSTAGIVVSTTMPPASVVTVQGSVLIPTRRDFNEALLNTLKLPTGFKVSTFATGLGNARMMAFGPNNTLYVTRREANDVIALNDRDGDGKVDQNRTVATDLKLVHGITISQTKMYLATDKKILTADIQADGTLSTPRAIVEDLPDAGQHPNRTIAFGPDGKLYVTIGSTCNNCVESNKEAATILQMSADGTNRKIFAMGLRNTIGFGWHPQDGKLWGMDHGSDWRGEDQPPEELNQIVENGDYGWPFCFADKKVDNYGPAKPPSSTKEEYCQKTLAPILTYQAHSAPLAMAFYTGTQFPAEYRNSAFVAMRCSWNRNPASGYNVVLVRFQNGQPTSIDNFMSSFLLEEGKAHFGRIAGMAVAPDGSLLVGEDTNGVIYRITYQP